MRNTAVAMVEFKKVVGSHAVASRRRKCVSALGVGLLTLICCGGCGVRSNNLVTVEFGAPVYLGDEALARDYGDFFTNRYTTFDKICASSNGTVICRAESGGACSNPYRKMAFDPKDLSTMDRYEQFVERYGEPVTVLGNMDKRGTELIRWTLWNGLPGADCRVMQLTLGEVPGSVHTQRTRAFTVYRLGKATTSAP